MKGYKIFEIVVAIMCIFGIAIPLGRAAFEEPKTETVSEPVIVGKTTGPVAEVESYSPPVTKCQEDEIEKESLGVFTITAYCSCKKCCGVWATKRPDGVVYGSSGEELTPNYSIATDPDVIPYGTRVLINGKEYVAQDTGGAIKGNRIDIYMSSHEEAIEWGKQSLEVWILKDDND